ncbi:hypothetical protein RFI_18327, partial [Reticulomyxa filosa]
MLFETANFSLHFSFHKLEIWITLQLYHYLLFFFFAKNFVKKIFRGCSFTNKKKIFDGIPPKCRESALVNLDMPKLIVCTINHFPYASILLIQPACQYAMFLPKFEPNHLLITALPVLLLLILVPRMWFLYFDWKLGNDQMTLHWKQQMYLGKFQLQNPSEALQQHIKNTHETIASSANQEEENNNNEVDIALDNNLDPEAPDELMMPQTSLHDSAPPK